MQGLWTNHRRSKVNLNASAPSSVPPSPLNTPRSEEPILPKASSSENIASTSSQITSSNDNADSEDLSASNKRKLRTSRSTTGEANKRLKSAGTTAKDYSPPSTRLSDLGGIEACVEKMLELIALPLCHPEIYLHTGANPPRGVLLHGPPGCGKTLLANAIAGVRSCLFHQSTIFQLTRQELDVPFISVSAPSIVSGMSGESEKTLRETFEEAKVCPELYIHRVFQFKLHSF